MEYDLFFFLLSLKKISPATSQFVEAQCKTSTVEGNLIFDIQAIVMRNIKGFTFREVSFFTGRGAPENWGDQVLFLRSKGGIKRFFQIKKGNHLYFLKK